MIEAVHVGELGRDGADEEEDGGSGGIGGRRVGPNVDLSNKGK